jgi:UDP-N-acetylmuramoylalanine--D-glutamate ligase
MHGKHNQANAAAAVAAARAFGIEPDHILEGFRRFRPLPHRMAFVGRTDDVSFYDDSKATNVDAAVTALNGLSEDHAVLIAGGRDKGGSYAPLAQALKDKGRALVVMGEAQDRIVREVRRLLPGEKLPIERVRAMGEAVERAFELARPGDAVLLSPACSSLDMFDNYAERGDAFIEAVERLRTRSKRGGG